MDIYVKTSDNVAQQILNGCTNQFIKKRRHMWASTEGKCGTGYLKFKLKVVIAIKTLLKKRGGVQLCSECL